MPASLEHLRTVAFVVAVALTPGAAVAAPPQADTSSEGDGLTNAQPESEPELPELQPEPEPEPEIHPEVTVEREPAPSGGGVAGAIVDPNDPNATRAQSDLEGESLDTEVEGLPERLPKLQATGWWLTFTAVALATTGGIFAGVAETRQDEAERLAYTFDLETGRATLYGEVADEYESLLRQGQNFQWVARGFIIAGGVAMIASIAVFAVDGSRRRKTNAAARLRLDPGPGLRLRF